MNQHLVMQSMAVNERPYELLEKKGASALTDAQLLSIILKSGTADKSALELANEILISCHGSSDPLNAFFRMDMSAQRQFGGIGRVKAIQIQAIAELSNRLACRKSKESTVLGNPASVADLYMEEMRHLTQEEVKAVYLSSKNKLLYEKELSKGSISRCIITPLLVFQPALECRAAAVMLLHNHPSGDPAPSQSDIELTKTMLACGRMMEIPLLDHIIIGDLNYYSMHEHGII